MNTLLDRKSFAKPRDEREAFLKVMRANGAGVCETTEAGMIWDGIEADRARWLRQNNRRLPHPDAIERARYPRPSRWEGSRNG